MVSTPQGELYATQLQIRYTYIGLSNGRLPRFLAENNEGGQWNSCMEKTLFNGLEFGYIGTSSLKLRAFVSKKDNGWEIADWETWMYIACSPVNTVEITASGINAAPRRLRGPVDFPKAQPVQKTTDLFGNYYTIDGKVQSITIEKTKRSKVIAASLSDLFLGDYSTFENNHFDLFNSVASPALKKTIQDSNFFSTLLSQGKQAGLLMEYNTDIGKNTSTCQPVYLYNGGNILWCNVKMILRQNAPDDLRKAFGLPARNVYMWSVDFYFSLVGETLSLEAFSMHQESIAPYLPVRPEIG